VAYIFPVMISVYLRWNFFGGCVYFDEAPFQPFKVIQGRYFWCQSKARTWLSISP